MLVAARSDEHESRLRPFPGARPPRRGQWTAGAHRSPIVFVTAVKVPNDRMRGSQFSSWNISLPYRRYGCASFLCVVLADLTPDKRGGLNGSTQHFPKVLSYGSRRLISFAGINA